MTTGHGHDPDQDRAMWMAQAETMWVPADIAAGKWDARMIPSDSAWQPPENLATPPAQHSKLVPDHLAETLRSAAASVALHRRQSLANELMHCAADMAADAPDMAETCLAIRALLLEGSEGGAA